MTQATQMQLTNLLCSLAALVFFSLAGCSVDNHKKKYILAEKLWADGKYSAAVSEFERVVKRDPQGKYGMQALFRGAMTQTVFLGQHSEAIEKFRLYIERSSEGSVVWSAQKQIGEILFSRLKQYSRAARHYKELLRLRPQAKEAPEFLFRLAKSLFFQWKFDEAIQNFQRITQEYSNTHWAEQAAYEIGLTYFTGGEQTPGGSGPGMEVYQKAITAFEEFVKKYPESRWVPEAQFGIASCYEELDQLEEAKTRYEALRTLYPTPEVIEIKLSRIRDRMTKRSR